MESERASDGAQPGSEWVTVTRRVIYGDTDAMGVVYYGNYMRFLEVGRCELLRARGRAYREIEASGHLFPVAEVRVKYLEPARYDDEVEVATRVEEVGRVSLRFGYRLRRAADGRVLAKGWTRHACLEKASGRVVRLPDELAAMLLPPS